MDLGVHLPLMRFRTEELSLRRLEQTVNAAKDCGFAAVSANDHFVFQTRHPQAGCERGYLWPLGDEQRQLERVASDVVPEMARDEVA